MLILLNKLLLIPVEIIIIIIRCIFLFLFMGRELTARLANIRLQISVLLQIFSWVIATTLWCENADRFPEQAKSDLTYLVEQRTVIK